MRPGLGLTSEEKMGKHPSKVNAIVDGRGFSEVTKEEKDKGHPKDGDRDFIRERMIWEATQSRGFREPPPGK